MNKKNILVLAVTSLLSSSLHVSLAATSVEDFGQDPLAQGWKIFGKTNLFAWNATNRNLEVTWDSSQPNTYFLKPLGTILGKEDDFSFAFDLVLSNFTGGVDPQKAGPFQLAVGLLNLGEATRTNFVRGTGADSPNLIEFSFFPDPGGSWPWGPSLTATMIDWTGTNWSSGGFAPLTLTSNDVYGITMNFTAATRTLHTTITRNGDPFGPISDTTLGSGFQDFRLDHIGVLSYSDAGQDPAYAGSVFAQGTIDNFAVTVPLPVSNVIGQFSNSVWQVQFLSRSNWLYSLERTLDFHTWSPVSLASPGNGNMKVLSETNSPSPNAFYRVKAQRQ